MTRLRRLLVRPRSIQHRLTWLLTAVSVGTLLAVNLAWLPAAIREVRGGQVDLQRIAVLGARDRITLFLEDKERALKAHGLLLRLPYREGDSAELRRLAYRFLAGDQAFEEIDLLDGGGNERFRLSRLLAFTEIDLRDRSGTRVFRESLERGMAWGEVLTGPTSLPKVTLGIRLPPIGSGGVTVVTGVIGLQSIWELTATTTLSHGGRAYVVDEGGRLIAADDPSLVLKQLSFAGRSIVQQLMRDRNAEHAVRGAYTNEHGARVMATGLPLPRPRWAVVVEQPHALLYAPVGRTLAFAVSLALAGLAAGVVSARLMSHRFTEPISRLRKEAEELGKGHLERRVTVDTGDELEDLATQFNQMAEALASSHQRLEDRVAERTRELSTLFETSRQAVSAVNLTEVLPVIIRSAADLLKCHAGSIRLLDRQTNTLRLVADNNLGEEFRDRGGIPLGQGRTGRAVLDGQPVVVEDVEPDPLYHHKAEALRAGIRSMAGVPLRTHDDIIGILSVYDTTPRRFSAEEVASLAEFAALASLAIEKARLFEATRQREKHLRAILATNRKIGTLVSLDVLLESIAREAARLLDVEGVGFRLLEGGDLVVAGRWGEAREMMQRTRLRKDESLSGWIATHGQPLLLSDLQADPRLVEDHRRQAQGLGLRAFLGVPLKVGERVTGVLTALAKERQFTETDLELATAFADQAAIAIENARLYAAEQRSRAAAEGIGQRFRDLVESLDAVVWEADVPSEADAMWSRQFRFVSARAESLLGYPVEDWLSDPEFWSRHLHPEDRESAAGRLGGPPRDGGRCELECRMVARDGRTVWVRDKARVVTRLDGRHRLRGLMIDITELKQLEQQMQQAQKMEAVGRLAGGVAHDFNNLLTVIMGRAERLLARDRDGAERESLELIQQTSQRAAALTRQLLAFSRRQVLQPKVLDINDVVANMQKMLRRLIGEDIEMVTVLAAGLPAVKADPAQLEQVIANLAVNARDAMPDGGRLTIESAAVELDEEYVRSHVGARPGHYVMLAMTDTGCGMDAHTQARIFEPFFTTKEVGKGTGLGLATVYGIVKQSGGFIWVQSEVGHGTTFKIYLPEVCGAPRTEDEISIAPPAPRGSETILLAEDDPDVRNLVSDMLSASGYSVLVAPDGIAAAEVSRRSPERVHLLLTDLVMPRMNGRELARRLVGARPELRVLYMSGYTDDAIVHQSMVDPGAYFIQKPFTARALAHKVREVLDAAPGKPAG